MKLSQLPVKTNRNVREFDAKNAMLLIKAGFVDQLSAGVFTWLPFGLTVLRKIEQIIRDELNSIGACEIVMPALISKTNWEQGKRWDGVDILFKTKSQTGKEYGLGFSHEEVVTPLVGQYIKSYKDLPMSVYQIQTKFRDELRAKSGILRGREFGMKDMYSFHMDESDFRDYYELVIRTYLKIFTRMGLNGIKITEASGGTFTKKHSHEFNVLTPAGEVDLVYCPFCTFARNLEITELKPEDPCPECRKNNLKSGKAIEVGNIFDLGTRFSDAFGVSYTDKEGRKKPIFMGCYGIGTTRLVGAIVEMSHDEKGIIWPMEVAPFRAHLISMKDTEAVGKKVYDTLISAGIQVLWDDRDVSAGVKFADADLIGTPWRLVVSAKTQDKVEMKSRSENRVELVSVDDCISLLHK